MAEPTTPAAAVDAPPVRAEDFEGAARAILPKGIYDYFAGGAEDEAAVAGNRAAFARWRFRYRVLTGASEPDLGLELFGRRLAMPIQLAPAATQKMAHPEGELAAARAATATGVVYCLSTLSTTSMETVATAEGVRWFQLYVFKDRGITTDMVDRAEAAGYQAIVLTVEIGRAHV